MKERRQMQMCDRIKKTGQFCILSGQNKMPIVM